MPERVLSAAETPAPDEAASGLEIRLFGPMEVRIGSHLLPRLRSRKGLWLLALLALRGGRDVDRDWLAETLWPDGDALNTRRSLRQSLYDLRAALGPEAWRLAGEAPRTLRLEVAGASVDVLDFDAAIARGAGTGWNEPHWDAGGPSASLQAGAPVREALEAAVRLYRGPLLEDGAEEWILAERRQREQAYVSALDRLAAAATARSEPAAAASYLRLAVAADPYREDLQRALMQALTEGGNPAGALVVYRQFRALLVREMSAEPAEETTALFRRLREETRARSRTPPRSPAPAPPVPPRRLPLPLTPLIGRDEAVREVIARLIHDRLVTLTGTGGVGKTRLALQVAKELADDYEDGVCFVDLAPLADPGTVPEAVRAALGVPPGDAQQKTVEVLWQYLSSRRLLLVLDNCEHLLNACAVLADTLLSQCPGLRILATSRHTLGLLGETVCRVPSLSLPDPGQGSGVRGQGSGTDRSARTPDPRLPPPGPAPSTLLQYAAVRLFVERARAAKASFEMTPGNASAIVQVCRRLDGIPLAIELAAARVRSLSVEQIAAHLDDRFRLLVSGSRAAPPRQQTLRATMDWSYALLEEPERVLLRRLSVFAGGWTLEAAEAVCARGASVESEVLSVKTDVPTLTLNTQHLTLPLEECQIIELLTECVDQSLVCFEEQGGVARYRLLETTREYGRERLGESGEAEAVRARHAEYFLALAEQVEPHIAGPHQAEWLDLLEVEHDNLRAALEWWTRADVGAEGGERGLRLAAALGPFWFVRGYWSEGRQRLAKLLALPFADGGWPIAERGLAGVGGMSPSLEPSFVVRHPQLAAARAKALNKAGGLADDQGDYETARVLQEESLAICRELGEPRGIADALHGLGVVAQYQGDLERAWALFAESLALRRELGDKRELAASLFKLGDVVRYCGDTAMARAFLDECLEIQRELGDPVRIAVVLSAYGSVVRDEGDTRRAHALLAESLALRRASGDRGGIAASLRGLAKVARLQGDSDAARALYVESLSIAHELGNNPEVANCLEGLAVSAVSPAGAFSRSVVERSARLWGAAEALRDAIGAPLSPPDSSAHDCGVAAARAALGEEAFDAVWAEGRAMTLAQAICVALEEPAIPATRQFLE